MLAKLACKSRATGALFRKPNGDLHYGLVAAFLLLNGIVFVNAVLHDPRVGYDSGLHLNYILTLAAAEHLPSFDETGAESFNPPLSYVLPAVVLRTMAHFKGSNLSLQSQRPSPNSEIQTQAPSFAGDNNSDRLLLGISAKFGQFLNWLFSIGLTLFLLHICELFRPGNANLKLWTMLLLGILPVYYKTFAFIRGEPLAAFLVVVSVYYFLDMLLRRDYTPRRSVLLGLAIGLGILARQWTFLSLPALASAVLISVRSRGLIGIRRAGVALAAALVIAALIGGWFYLSYPWGAARPGQMASYLAKVSGDPYWTQVNPLSFSVNARNLFTSPVRDALPNQVVSIFYSEVWGDYWGYFVTTKSEQSMQIQRYLGRVNLISLLPTVVFIAGLGVGLYALVRSAIDRRPADDHVVAGLCTLIIVWSLIGYGYFLTAMPNTSYGAVIKATYMLQIFPFAAILGAATLERVTRERPRWYWLSLIVLIGVAMHNSSAMITHYVLTSGKAGLAW